LISAAADPDSADDRSTAPQWNTDTAAMPSFMDATGAATNGGWALGDASFKRQLADALRRRVTPLPRGRPRTERAAKQRQLIYSDPFTSIRCFPRGSGLRGSDKGQRMLGP
jgi:hypothetical protein